MEQSGLKNRKKQSIMLQRKKTVRKKRSSMKILLDSRLSSEIRKNGTSTVAKLLSEENGLDWNSKKITQCGFIPTAPK